MFSGETDTEDLHAPGRYHQGTAEAYGIDEALYLCIEGLVEATVALKLEGANPAGSIKLKTAIGLIEAAEWEGRNLSDSVLIESSSGNLGIALAMLCAQRGYRFCCVVDPNTPKASVHLMRTFGAEVICIEKRDAQGGFLGNRIRYIEECLRHDPRYIWLNQYKNPAGPEIHRVTTGPAIHGALPNITHLFVGAGTTGTLMGCASYFKEKRPETRIIAVDTAGSITFGDIPGPRYIPGMGTSRVPEICDPGLVDAVILIPEIEGVRFCREIARRSGWLLGGSTGSVLAAVRHPSLQLPSSAVVAAISPDFGERYSDTIYNNEWVIEKFGPEGLSSPDGLCGLNVYRPNWRRSESPRTSPAGTRLAVQDAMGNH